MINKVGEFVSNQVIDFSSFNTDDIVKSFEYYMIQKSDDEFCEFLITAGYIPDFYESDSNEENLFTKLHEVLEILWAVRMGFESNYISPKSSFEDVDITIDNEIIVSDTKTFRLGRSQHAPNVKDFVKPEDYSKWIKRHKIKKLVGLVVYPQLHEWKKSSDAYILFK